MSLTAFCQAALLHSYSRSLNAYFAKEHTVKDVFRVYHYKRKEARHTLHRAPLFQSGKFV